MKTSTTQQELELIHSLFTTSLEKVLSRLEKYSAGELVLPEKRKALIEKEFAVLKADYKNALKESATLAKLAQKGKNRNPKRLYFFNPKIKKYKDQIQSVFHPSARGWVMDCLVIKNQTAGLKRLAGLPAGEDVVIDVLNSAASLALGGENPWLIKADRAEDHLGLRDNMCAAYHPGLRQGFALQELAKLYPGNRPVEELSVHSESSGSVVDSIAIESVVAFAEKSGDGKTLKKVLAVDGTWAGAYGSSKEGTGFGVDASQKKRTGGKSLWVERVLVPPTKENKKQFLATIKEHIENKTMAGLYIEPDNIGDLGIIHVDPDVLREAVALLKKHKLPIIADCVQQLGRTGSYWGENVDNVLAGYPWLVITTAKSASNGQPFGFVIMPKEIAESAQPLSMVSTNEMNGPLLRALVVAETLQNPKFQKWVARKGKEIEKIAQQYAFPLGDTGLRGGYLSRALYVGDNETVKLVQIALLIEDGVLVGALPQSIRYQPMLFELEETNRIVAEIIMSRTRKVLDGEVSAEVQEAYNAMKNLSSGLAR